MAANGSAANKNTGNDPSNPKNIKFETTVPASLKQLARLVSRGFYLIEESLIIDMLVRYHCMREEDLASLLKFDRKFLRSKIDGLKKDKIIQIKQRIETDEEGRVSRMNCYFINYKIFVNIVKYKLDHMHKKMETSERDATNRSSFKCTNCRKTFTDLEANQLFDPMSGEFSCTFCSSPVEEDESAGPQSDSRQLLAKFNDQMKTLYDLLMAVENINLAVSLLEPEPVEINSLGKPTANRNSTTGQPTQANIQGQWSGDATRLSGLRPEDTKVKISFGETDSNQADVSKEVPIWMQQSTVTNANLEDSNSMSSFPGGASMAEEDSNMGEDQGDSIPKINQQDADEITSLLLRHETRNSGAAMGIHIPKESESDKSDESDEDEAKKPANYPGVSTSFAQNDVQEMSEDDDEDGDIPTLVVGGKEITFTDVTNDMLDTMTVEEKERYNQIYQDFYSHIYE